MTKGVDFRLSLRSICICTVRGRITLLHMEVFVSGKCESMGKGCYQVLMLVVLLEERLSENMFAGIS